MHVKLFLLTFCLIFLVISAHRSYIFVNTPMQSDEAESYCVNNYGTHLATVISASDRAAAIDAYCASSTSLIWIGLNRETSTNWEWKDGTPCVPGGDAHYCSPTNWWINLGQNSKCGVMHKNNNGLFNDWHCSNSNSIYTFLCNAPSRSYIFVNTPMKSNDAKSYCMNNYGTTLATIITDSQKAAAVDAYSTSSTSLIWIGLNRETSSDWEWADGTPCVNGGDPHYCTPTNWWLNLGQGSKCTAMHKNNNGAFNDWHCSSSNSIYTFLCNSPYDSICSASLPPINPQLPPPEENGYWYNNINNTLMIAVPFNVLLLLIVILLITMINFIYCCYWKNKNNKQYKFVKYSSDTDI